MPTRTKNERINPDIFYMPWANVKNEIKVGKMIFSPWTESRKHVQNETERDYLDWLFRLYVDMQGNEVDSITTCHSEKKFRKTFNEEEISDVFNSSSALSFCFIYSSIARGVKLKNPSLGPPSSARFVIYRQPILKSKEIVLSHSGSTQYWSESANMKLSRPSHIVDFELPAVRQDLCDGFGNLLCSKSFEQEKRKRIFRALEWFKLAHTTSDEVPWKTKVVAMCTAFETLFDVQGQNKAAEIADRLDEFSDSGAKEDTRTDKNGKTKKRTLKAFWGWDFYGIRNQIIHGNDVRAQQIWFVASEMDWL